MEDPAADAPEGTRRPTPAQRAEYLLVRTLAFVLSCTDLRGASRLAATGALLLGRVLRARHAMAAGNIRATLPGFGEGDRAERMVDEVFRGLGRTCAEFVHGPRRLRGRARRRWFRVEGHEAYAGIPVVVFLSAHFGNWEHSPAAAGTVGFRLSSIARPLDNPLMDRWITAMRVTAGASTVVKYGGLRGLMREARAGRSIAMMVDQSANRYGRLVPFFGRPVSMVTAGVALARRLRAPVCVGTMLRDGPGRHTLYLDPPLWVGAGREGEDRVLFEVNRRLERHILRRPADWLWLHRRWRVKADWKLETAVPTEEAS